MTSNSPYIMTSSGRRFYLLDMTENVFDIEEIADALSKLCRFTGHTCRFYSVAEHSVRVARLVPFEHRISALLHDAAEAYLGDVASPLRSVLPDYNAIYPRVEDWIRTKISQLTPNTAVDFHHDEVKAADRFMFEVEAPFLLPKGAWGEMPTHLYGWNPAGWSPTEARRQFLDLLRVTV